MRTAQSTQLQRVLAEEQERRTAEAYRRQPDVEPAYVEASAWQCAAPTALRPKRTLPDRKRR